MRFRGDHPNSRGGLFSQDGTQVAYFDASKRFFNFKLSDPPWGPALGPSQLRPGVDYVIRAHWPEDEMRRWNAFNERANQPNSHSAARNEWDEPYSSTEKEWLRQFFESEFKFLLQHGLSINKEDDRAEGRSIVRAMMEKERASYHPFRHD